MRFTTFDRLTDNRPITRKGWNKLLELLDEPHITNDKQSVPLYCAARFVGTRSRDNVLHASLGIADIDSADEDDVNEVVEELEDLGIHFVYHTTHSYSTGLAEGKHKCRLIFKLSRAVEPDEWDRFWHALNELCHEILDPACKDPCRIYFFPSAPVGEQPVVAEISGEPLDVDELLRLATPISTDDSVFAAPSEDLLRGITSTTRYKLAKNFLAKYPLAIEKQGGDNRTFRAACIGGDFGLSPEEFWPLLQTYNQRCKPPWTEKELKKKLKNAEKYGELPFGWRLVGKSQEDRVTRDDIAKVIAKLLKSRDGRQNAKARLVRSMLDGEGITTADPERTMENTAQLLAEKFTYANPENLAEPFKDCLKKTSHQDVNMKVFLKRIEAAQESRQVEAAQERLERQEFDVETIKMAFRGIKMKRDYPYTEDELEDFAEEHEHDQFAGLNRHWVIRKGRAVYFFVGGEYIGPYTQEEAISGAQIFLSPATHIELTSFSPSQGIRTMGLNEITNRYGCLAKDIIADMTIQRSFYDHEESIFYEATCPMRDLEPEYNSCVETWLELLCGNSSEIHERVLDWLACLSNVQHPICALFLYGERATGKSLFGSACARLWTTSSPTELMDVAGNFNSRLAKCPLVVGDEGPPKDNRGDPNTTLLRKLITEHTRTYRRKHIPDSTLHGAMRLVISCNSLDDLISKRITLTNHDIAAINERFLCVPVLNTKAKKYLEALPKKDKEPITHGSAIVQHALWLEENRQVNQGSRLLVEGIPGSPLEMLMTTELGLRSEICHWLASYLRHPERVMGQGSKPLVHTAPTGRNELLLTSTVLHTHWEVYCANKPPITAIQKALGGLSERRREVKGEKYRVVHLDYVREWAASNGHTSEGIFNKLLVKHKLGKIRTVQ